MILNLPYYYIYILIFCQYELNSVNLLINLFIYLKFVDNLLNIHIYLCILLSISVNNFV